ncbi:YabP/YqfC family sporulation protein, partial [Dysosmobacter welbionis]
RFIRLNLGLSSPASCGSNSFRRILASVSGLRCRLSIPPMATEMDPVSSETMTTTASAFSLMPIPARWRIPSSRERFTFLLRGSMHPAPSTRPFRTMT